jgi:MFS family permease
MFAGPILVRRSTGFLLACALAYAGGVIGYLPLLTLLLPVKVEGLAGDARLDVLTACVVAGTLVSSVSNIGFGVLSDRSVARGGGRRRWLAAGLVITAFAYAALAAAATPVAVVGAVMLFQVGVNAVLAPLLAAIADEVPDGQKGTAGALFTFANPAASALSSWLVGMAALGEAGRLLLIPVAVAACALPFLLVPPRIADEIAAASPTGTRRDLAVAWGARLLVQVAGNALFLYLLYYFESVAPAAARGALAADVGRLLILAYLLPLPVALLAGRFADRTGRHKPFLLAAAAVAAGGLVGMAMANSWSAGAAAFCVYAVGSAVFLALHAAFAMQLLPSPRHRGRDLGLLNLTNTLPALLAPLLTWWLASPHDFARLMLLLAALTLLGGLLLLAATSRR